MARVRFWRMPHLFEVIYKYMHLTEKKVSVVSICYHDAEAVPIMYQRLTDVLKKITPDYEIIFVNDASPDNAEEVLSELTRKDTLVTVINHSRNFGSQSAFSSGMAQAMGDAVILIDGDLQDPPEMIEDFVKKWLEGHEVVYGIRKKREGHLLLRMCYKIFYRIFAKMSYIKIPFDAGDFCLMDRKVVNILNNMPEKDRFIRGLRAWTGFRQTGIEYVRPERMFGTTTYSLAKNIEWAKKGIFSFSYLPLSMISYAALFVIFLSVVGAIVVIIGHFLDPAIPRGIAFIIVTILFLGGIQLLFIGVLSEYVGRIFEEVKARPKYIIKNILNDHKRKGD